MRKRIILFQILHGMSRDIEYYLIAAKIRTLPEAIEIVLRSASGIFRYRIKMPGLLSSS